MTFCVSANRPRSLKRLSRPTTASFGPTHRPSQIYLFIRARDWVDPGHTLLEITDADLITGL